MFSIYLTRLDKLLQVVRYPALLRGLLRHRVLAGAEHRCVLAPELKTVVDIGANRGQFALAARQWSADALVIAFEPLPGPARIFRSLFAGDNRVQLHEAAIGPCEDRCTMHISARDDSSSLLPIAGLQDKIFPGTGEVALCEVAVAPLASFISPDAISAPAMLKLDVQGFEYEALHGCESLLPHFDMVYCECSFVELYKGQRLAGEVIGYLGESGFTLSGIYNPSYDQDGNCIQADLLFTQLGKS